MLVRSRNFEEQTEKTVVHALNKQTHKEIMFFVKETNIEVLDDRASITSSV